MLNACPAPEMAHPVVIIPAAKRRSRYTAAQLIEEARREKHNYPPADAFDTIRDLPRILPNILELILMDFDIRANPGTTTAIACRGLAAFSAQFIDLFQKVDKGDN